MVRHHHRRTLWLGALLLAAPAMAQPPDGLELMRDSEKGNCSICHQIPGIGLPVAAQGNIGPPLAGVGARLTQTEIRDHITDPRRANPQTVMPAYGTTLGLIDVDARFAGRPILTPAEIDAIAARLAQEK